MRDDAEYHGCIARVNGNSVIEDEIGHAARYRHCPHSDHRSSQHPYVQQTLAEVEDTETQVMIT